MALLYIHIIHIINIFPARLRIIAYIQGIFCDIINIYTLYKVKAQESSPHCYSLRERVGLDSRVISGSDLKPSQYVFKYLVNV